MEIIFNEIFRALGYLLIAYVVLIAYTLAYDNAKGGKLKKVLWKGFLWCAAIALFSFITMGHPTCEEPGDAIYGKCEQYADNGYTPTKKERGARFAYFMTLLYIPVILGAFKGHLE